MKTYYRLFFAFALLFTLFQNPAWAGPGTPFTKIVFFGDSLTDNGNLYFYDLRFMPKNPPYFAGRFSNNYVWSDLLAAYFKQHAVQADNYAIGGETAVLHNPANGFLPYSLTASIGNYILRTSFQDRSHTLFIMWIGANDYMPGVTDADGLSTKVVASIKNSIETLIGRGGMNFIIINLPNLARTPSIQARGEIELYQKITDLHNTKLAAAIDEISANYKQVHAQIFNVDDLLEDLISHPDVYNQKYAAHITDTTTSCWLGGYTLHGVELKQDDIEQQLKRHLSRASAAATTSEKPLDTSAFASYIIRSPALLETYKVAKSADEGKAPCDNPDEHIFWDRMHPTGAVHKMFFQGILTFIEENYSQVGMHS